MEINISRAAPEFARFYLKVAKTITEKNMLEAGETVLVAVSGGADSVALLHSLFYLQKSYNLCLHVFHLDHQLRSESSQEASFVRELATSLAINCTVKSSNIRSLAKNEKLTIQEAARKTRLSLAIKIAKEIQAKKIALGHNRDDVVETLLMRLIKGSSLGGLASIKPVSYRQGIALIRPLIELSAKEIRDFLSSRGIKYVNDPSNITDKYSRNKIRHQLIPVLKSFNKKAPENIYRTIGHLLSDEIYLQKIAKELYRSNHFKRWGDIWLPVDFLLNLPTPIFKRLVYQAIYDIGGDLKNLNTNRFKRLKDFLVERREKTIALDKLSTVCLHRGYVIIFQHHFGNIEGEQNLVYGRETKVSSICSIRARLVNRKTRDDETRRDKAFINPALVEKPLKVRGVKPGDRFCPLGMEGEKKLQDFFTDEGVPRHQRQRIPIVTDKKGIIWLAGFRIDRRVKIDTQTSQLLVLELLFGG
jgi:tRNA(Ile)-lysidine synthase